MFEQQDIFDLQANGSFNDPKSWLSGAEDQDQSSTSSPPHPQRSLSNNVTDSNFDRVLYKNLVEMVPLVESLMERRANTSFTRRASLVYTKTPSRESCPRKSELKGRKAAQSIPTKKRGNAADSCTSKGASVDDFSIFAARTSVLEKDSEALITVQEQVKSLQKILSEKDELIKSAETSLSQMTSLKAEVNELKRHIVEKDSLIKSVYLQLSDAKIKLADKQAVLEKLQWEAAMSNTKAEKLKEDIESMQGEVSSFMLLFEGLTENDSTAYSVDYDITPYEFDQLPYMDDMDELEMQHMEEAREAYLAALATAKENQDDESLAVATEARLHLQSFVLRPQNANPNGPSYSFQVSNASAEVFVQ